MAIPTVRVCLINPPSSFLLDERVFPPLGVLRVASSLERRGVEVEVVDLSGREPLMPNVKADAYGITATSAQMPAAMLLRRQIDGKVILGGAHATMAAAASRRGSERGKALLSRLLDEFDCVVAGDGEDAIVAALDGTGLIDADDTKSPLYVKDQDGLAPPARHLIDFDSYHYEIDGKRATSVVTQLGCPFGCGFCGGRYSSFYRRVRVRTVAAIMAEITELHARYGIEGFMFLDDELNVSPQMTALMRELQKYQSERGVQFAMRGFVKASLFTTAQANAMSDAGFKEILMGFESGHDRILRNIQKGSVGDNTRAIETAHHSGLRVKALMSLGHPGESSETIRATRDWLMDVGPDDFDATVITTYPGTPYWDDAVRNGAHWTYTAKGGDRLHMEDTDYEGDTSYYKGVPGEYRAHVHTDFLTSAEIVSARDALEKEVRDTLSISWPGTAIEHSMGQSA